MHGLQITYEKASKPVTFRYSPFSPRTVASQLLAKRHDKISPCSLRLRALVLFFTIFFSFHRLTVNKIVFLFCFFLGGVACFSSYLSKIKIKLHFVPALKTISSFSLNFKEAIVRLILLIYLSIFPSALRRHITASLHR